MDKKWFYVLKGNVTFYFTPSEKSTHHLAKSKKFIAKVMFLCAVARPRQNAHTTSLLMENWPFGARNAAIRISNRPVKIMEIKPAVLPKGISTDFLLEKVSIAFRTEFPFQIYVPGAIQQDNSRPHIEPSNSYIEQAGLLSGRNLSIQIVYQPPKSSDFNVLELVFWSIQSLRSKIMARTIEDAVTSVEPVFQMCPKEKLQMCF